MDFCDKLVELRRARGWSQETLADYLDVSRQAVSKWEAGRAMPDIPKLITLADLMNVSLDDLLRDKKAAEDDPHAPVAMGPLVAARHLVYEYKSKTKVFGIPLVHIKSRRFAGPPAVAKGIFAVGDVAVGLVALGGVAVGGIALGGLPLGLLLALGGIAVGSFTVGGFALGLFAFGGVAIGGWALGGLALGGQVAIGGFAGAPVAIGGEASGAVTFLADSSLPREALVPQLRAAIAQYAPLTPEWFIGLCQMAL